MVYGMMRRKRQSLFLPSGVPGNYATSPDAAALSYTGDSDLRVWCAPTDWTPLGQNTMIAQWATAGNQRRQQFQINTDGTLRYQSSADGTAVITSNSTAAVSFDNNMPGWVRVTLDVNDGGGNHVVTFYTSADGTNWTQLGTAVTTAGATSLFDSTAIVEIGTTRGDAADRFSGRILRAQMRDGIGGTIVFDADFTDQSRLIPPFATFLEKSSNAATVTITTTGLAGARVIRH